MKSFAAILIAIFLGVSAVTAGASFDECLEKDSISCLQKSLFRKAKEFFDRDNLELAAGVSLVRAESSRGARSGKELAYEQEIVEGAETVADRQTAIENFIGDEVSDFFRGRSLRINFSPALEKIGSTARAVSDSIPSEVREAVDEMVEGRGKKKSLKKFLPLLLIAKAKIGLLMTLGYFVIALLAKKAILISLVSIAISSFMTLRSLFSKKFGGTSFDFTGYNNNAAGGWSSAGASANAGAYSNGWASNGAASAYDDNHGGYAAQSQAYAGYH